MLAQKLDSKQTARTAEMSGLGLSCREMNTIDLPLALHGQAGRQAREADKRIIRPGERGARFPSG